MMKDTVELAGRVFESKSAICDRLGVSLMSLRGWHDRDILPKPVRLGRSNYYDRDELDKRLTAACD
jgi:hypothetical protein